MANQDDLEFGLHDRTGALLMLNKKERELIRELLILTLNSKSAKDWIVKKLGGDYLDVGQRLLASLGGP